MKPRNTRPGRATEHQEQVAVIQYCDAKYPDLIKAAVPNGGKRSLITAVLLKKEGVLPSYPDLVFDEARGGYFGLRIEMKQRKVPGMPTPKTPKKQRDLHDLLRSEGYHVAVCYGAGEALKVIDEYMGWAKTHNKE